MKTRIKFISTLLSLVVPIAAASEPPSFLIDEGACPYEGCTYGTWTAGKPVSVHSKPDEGSPIIGTIKMGESVQALTGQVHVVHAKFVVNKPHGKYKEGDILWVYTYQGEGRYKVWFRGGSYNEDLGFSPHGGSSGSRCEASSECWGELENELQSTWWVQVKKSDGVTGWTADTEHFENTSLGGLSPSWHGTWESEDGRSTLTVTAKRIVVSDLRDLPGEVPERASYGYDWSNALEANGDNPLTFGYSSEYTSQQEMRARFEEAVAVQKADSAGVFQIRDADAARRIADALTPGTHEKIWAYGEGDFDVKYVVDEDAIVEVDDNMYGFGLRKFNRVAGSAKQTEESQGNPTQSDKIEVEDGSSLVGTLKDAKVPFTSSFGFVEVDLREVRSFGEGKLSLADGTVLNGQFGEKEIEITTSRGDLSIQAQDIVAIDRGSGEETPATETSVRLTAGQGVLTGRVFDNFRKPVRGASVRILGSAFETTTDQVGRYQLKYVPGALDVQIELSGYDPVQFSLNLSEPSQYPVEDKTLLKLPPQHGVFYWGKADWSPLGNCSLKQTKAIGGKIDYAGVRKDAHRVSGSPLRIPIGGTAMFLDNTQSRGDLLIFRVDNNDEIITSTRAGGFGGIAGMLSPGGSKQGTSQAQYGKGRFFPGRNFYVAKFQPGVYAIVDRSYKKTCFKFQVGETAHQFQQPAKDAPPEARTLTVVGKSVSYWRTLSQENHANFRFESEGYKNTYLLDCKNKRFLWTENVRVSTGKVTGSSAGAEWRPMNPKSTISNAVYDATCPSILSGKGNATAKKASAAEEASAKDSAAQTASTEKEKGPSFDCSKAAKWSEKAVCNDAPLAALDMQVASLYRRARDQLKGSQLDAVKSDQKAWLRQREACKSDSQPSGCLRTMYDTRISQLRSITPSQETESQHLIPQDSHAADTKQPGSDVSRLLGVWEYNDPKERTKKYIAVKEYTSGLFRFSTGFAKEGGGTFWQKIQVATATGDWVNVEDVFLKPANGQLLGEFVSSNFYATHGKNFTYKITLTPQSGKTLTYSVWASIREGITDEWVARKISD